MLGTVLVWWLLSNKDIKAPCLHLHSCEMLFTLWCWLWDQRSPSPSAANLCLKPASWKTCFFYRNIIIIYIIITSYYINIIYDVILIILCYNNIYYTEADTWDSKFWFSAFVLNHLCSIVCVLVSFPSLSPNAWQRRNISKVPCGSQFRGIQSTMVWKAWQKE